MARDTHLDDYVEVAERIRQFYDRYPEGRLDRESEPEFREVGGKLFIIYRARAYRYPADPKPGRGMAWEPFPGPTSFTKDSELMNAETAAIGRAIVAVGIVAKKIASKEEVTARTGENGQPPKVPAPQKITRKHAESLLELVTASGLKGPAVEMKLRSFAAKGLSDLNAEQALEVSAWATSALVANRDAAAKAGESA